MQNKKEAKQKEKYFQESEKNERILIKHTNLNLINERNSEKIKRRKTRTKQLAETIDDNILLKCCQNH